MLAALRRVLYLAVRPRVILHRVPVVRARYDAAQTTPDNFRHWAAADSLSANAANSPAVRHTLRIRSRYEIANNSYAKGIVLTLANDTIGTGPRLQTQIDDDALSRAVEREFAAWAEEVRLADLLRTMRMAKATDGEVFALLARADAPMTRGGIAPPIS
ncbi:MAG: Phage portal protein, lambda family [Lentisphaerae bacterium ADurb.BinA184]|nr:MAG: Phage portal protein, lambda family [Lentisphaerae bacterium ADurb.BinA184]